MLYVFKEQVGFTLIQHIKLTTYDNGGKGLKGVKLKYNRCILNRYKGVTGNRPKGLVNLKFI
jgi:hypothetical protein